MKGHVILSHGSESGPDAIKVSVLAKVAQACGWRVTRPDYRDLDGAGEIASIAPRIARLVGLIEPGERCVLAGSSMGAFVSGPASLQGDVEALFLLALPIVVGTYPAHFDAARVPCTIVHGWDDELCPAVATIAFAGARQATLLMLPDTHRLAAHVDFIADQFRLFLLGLDAVAAFEG